MNDLLYKRKTPRRINWPELVLYAEAAGEGFTELTITTLKSHYNNKCQEVAVSSVAYYGDEDAWFENIQRRAEWEMDNGNWTVRESVTVDKNMSAQVVIDADAITDIEVDIALTWLEQANIPGTKHFGEPKSFNSQQISEIIDNANTSR